MATRTHHKNHALGASAPQEQSLRSLALPVGIAVAAVSAFVWSYWETATDLCREWRNGDDYSVGLIVPLVALYLVWRRRAELRNCRMAPCWWGLVLVLLALAARTYGLLFLYESAERYAMVLTILGLVLLLAGRQVATRMTWILLFLFLMVPLPGRVHNMISGPLQAIATRGAVFILEVFSVSVTRQGNTMLLDGRIPIAVAEACSGLRMLTAFVVVAAAMAFLVKRSAWQKATLVLSSVPIAIACNLARLSVTGVLYLNVDSETAERFFHDFAGLVMMPCAVVLLLAELWLFDKLVIAEDGQAKQQPGHKAADQAAKAEHTSRSSHKQQRAHAR